MYYNMNTKTKIKEKYEKTNYRVGVRYHHEFINSSSTAYQYTCRWQRGDDR